MKVMFKCISTGDYHLTIGKDYMITLNVGKSNLVGIHNLITNDKGVQHLLFEKELEKQFVDIQKQRHNKLNELGI